MAVGRCEASSSGIMCLALAIELPLVLRSPRSFQIAVWDSRIWKAYLESVKIVREDPCAKVKAQVRAISSACWFVVLGGKGFASIVLSRETMAYPAH